MVDNIKCLKCNREKHYVFLTQCNHTICLFCIKAKDSIAVCPICNSDLKCKTCYTVVKPIKQQNREDDWDDTMIYYDNMKSYDDGEM